MRTQTTAFKFLFSVCEDEYREKNYHRPSDEYDAATWTMEGAIKDLKLLFAVGKRLAFETTMPGWKEGSEFKNKR